MSDQTAVTLEQVLAMAQQLTPTEQAQLVERLSHQEPEGAQVRSLYGLWAEFQVDISEEDIDGIRREMWANFPREDIV